MFLELQVKEIGKKEDPRDELISKINEQIKSGIDESFKFLSNEDRAKNKSVYEISDREEAIGFGLSLAGVKDTVIITGKGHEASMNYGHGEIPWSDEEVVRKFLNKK